MPAWLRSLQRGSVACSVAPPLPSPVLRGYRNKCAFICGRDAAGVYRSVLVGLGRGEDAPRSLHGPPPPPSARPALDCSGYTRGLSLCRDRAGRPDVGFYPKGWKAPRKKGKKAKKGKKGKQGQDAGAGPVVVSPATDKASRATVPSAMLPLCAAMSCFLRREDALPPMCQRSGEGFWRGISLRCGDAAGDVSVMLQSSTKVLPHDHAHLPR